MFAFVNRKNTDPVNRVCVLSDFILGFLIKRIEDFFDV